MNLIQTEQFIKFMKAVENESLAKNGYPVLHDSPEGGSQTLGYGHKLNLVEQSSGMVQGWLIEEIGPTEAEWILAFDIENAARQLARSVPKWDKRTQREKEMLVDMQFNLGNVEKVFPKFYKAVLERDIEGQKKEYKRYFRNEKGNWKELRRRNRLFYSRYLSPMAIKAWGDAE